MYSNKLLVFITATLAAGGACAQATVKDDGQGRAALGAAYSKTSGNADTASFALQADAVRATPQNKWTLYASNLYAESAGAKTADQLRVGTRYDHNLSERLFAFSGLDAERDQIALLDSRFTLSGGLGYKVIKEANTTWDVFSGAGYVAESYGAPRLVDNSLRDNYDYATLLLSEESTHKLSDTTNFKQRLIVYPNLKNRGEYRAQFDAALSVAMSKTLNLTAGASVRYNSDPGFGFKKTDLLLTTGVAMKFE